MRLVGWGQHVGYTPTLALQPGVSPSALEVKYREAYLKFRSGLGEMLCLDESNWLAVALAAVQTLSNSSRSDACRHIRTKLFMAFGELAT